MSTNKNDKSERQRRRFTPEYKAEVVRLCRDKSPHAVARELGLMPSAVAGWVRQKASMQKGGSPGL